MAEIYENTVEGLCKRVSARLADYDEDTADRNNTWSECLVKTTVIDTLGMVSLLMPDLFTEEVEFDLEPGSCGQRLPEECARLVGFSCVITPNGTVPVTMGDYNSVENIASFPAVRRKKCRGDTRMSQNIASFTAAISTTNPRFFVINPLPANGETYKIIAECIALDDWTDNSCEPLPDELRPWIIPIVELSLYQLLSIDSADAATSALAQGHLQAFLNFTAINIAQVRTALAEIQDLGAGRNAA